MNQTQFRLEVGFAETTYVGRGDYKVVRGWCFHPDKKVAHINIKVGDQTFPVADIGDMSVDVTLSYCQADRQGHSVAARFWGMVPILPAWVGTVQTLRAEVRFDDGGTESYDIGTTHFVSVTDAPKLLVPKEQAEGAELVICLATYNPRLAAFREQIDSIIAQSHRDWVCIVNDDCSSPQIYEGIRQICGRDPRFHVRRNPINLGFYRNFEAALKAVPASARFVALADQDDYWYPKKLEKCLDAFNDETKLVYSDMRIVRADTTKIADTYWVNRKNNYQDFTALFLANTVTGAASVFRADLLPTLLPFPDPTRESCHDQWIACVALALGKVAYVNEPLYDYIQHGQNSIGHADNRVLTTERKLRFAARALSWVFRPQLLKQKIADFRHKGLALYDLHYRQRQVVAATLARRLPQARNAAAVLKAFGSAPFSTLRLLAIHLRLARKEPTASELALLFGFARLVKRANDWYVVAFRRRLLARFQATQPGATHQTGGSVGAHDYLFLQRKTAPLNLVIDAEAPQRVNILIGEINASVFFGGYMGMFHFAKRLAETGHNVRLVTVDPCAYDIEAWRRFSRDYKGLEDIFDRVEVACCGDRDLPLVVNPADAAVATSVWTAYVADDMAKILGRGKFVFLAQEYEPFFHPMGSYYALAVQAYHLPHHALFSTQILADYFREQKAGVYSDQLQEVGCEAACFHNAILSFNPSAANMAHAGKRKFLFYCRPEAHAARNLFEIGYLALNEAIRTGILDSDEWEYYGIGSSHGDIPLFCGQTLKMLGKMGLKQYQDMLPQYDLGISLMYTPHPSLVPQEMAAAGMVAVTNTCLNKTAERLRAISPNLIAAEPTIEGVLDALRKAVTRVPDHNARIAGSRVNWPSDWRVTFDDALMATMTRWFMEDIPAITTPHCKSALTTISSIPVARISPPKEVA